MHQPQPFPIQVNQRCPSSTDNIERRYKKQKISHFESFAIPFSCFDMFSHNSSQVASPAQHSSASADDVLQHSRESKLNEAWGDILEPTPFRDGTALAVSSRLQGRYAVSLSQQSNSPQRLAPTSRPRSQKHAEEDIQTSWMAAVDRIINNTSLDLASHKEESSQVTSLSSNVSKRPTKSQSLGKRARSEQQLAIDDPTDTNFIDESLTKSRFRPYQKDQWDQQFQELIKFKDTHGHCHVPHTCEGNPSLSRWAKRQRYQYKRKLENKQSSMSDARQQKLDDVGFVWDLQTMVWQERYNELVEYKRRIGDCNVPCRYDENPTLGMWVKCQRRQYKLYRANQLSRLTPGRFQLLTSLGFNW